MEIRILDSLAKVWFASPLKLPMGSAHAGMLTNKVKNSGRESWLLIKNKDLGPS